ncbi:putative helix-turn-helix transcriptional regulator [Fusobacterium phage vB_FnuS_FNU4]|nr:putative helix-turn-helix transcriptional regulator [Fusobacterium phage vB_FnuS_FNU4]
MATWENFKKKMFKKNKNFERDFKEIERRMKMENYFEDLKRFKNSLSEVGLPAEVEVEVLKIYAIAKTKRMIRYNTSLM